MLVSFACVFKFNVLVLEAVLKLLSEGLRGKDFISNRGIGEDSGGYLARRLGKKMSAFYLKTTF